MLVELRVRRAGHRILIICGCLGGRSSKTRWWALPRDHAIRRPRSGRQCCGTRRHNPPVSPAARHARTSSGDWRQRADPSAPVISKGGQLIGRSLRLGRLALGSARRIPH